MTSVYRSCHARSVLVSDNKESFQLHLCAVMSFTKPRQESKNIRQRWPG